MSDSVDKQIEGVCEEISEKNGWTSFAINVGSQYPVRLSTKLPALIEKGRAAGQERAVWKFKESQGGENPNKPGTFYTNRYLDGVEVGGTVAPAAATSSGTPRSTATADPTRGSIERQVIVKEMVQHYPDIDTIDESSWWDLVYELTAFLAHGVPTTPPVVDERGVLADDIPFD